MYYPPLNSGNSAIVHFKDKEIFIENSDYLYQGTIIKSKLKGVESCTPSGSSLHSTSYFSSSPITLLDSVTLKYNFTGSNHFVIGVNSNKLYYYELNLNNQNIKFKSPNIRACLNKKSMTNFR